MKVFHKPFKGFMAYEIQVGPIVVQMFYDKQHKPWQVWKRFHVWRDSLWKCS